MKLNAYDTVILGSGYFSLGFAATHKNTLIIEDTQLLDPNFYGTLSGFDMNAERPSSNDAVSMYNAFLTEGVIGNNSLAINELESVICRFVSPKMPNILLGTFCTDVKKTNSVYEIVICNNEGISSVLANHVIDTRIACGNRMNLLIALDSGREPKLSNLSPSFYDDQRVITLDFDGCLDINEAKSRMLDIVEDKLAEVGARIVCTSYRMCGSPIAEAYEDENSVLHIDERSFGDIFKAYEKGAMWK